MGWHQHPIADIPADVDPLIISLAVFFDFW